MFEFFVAVVIYCYPAQNNCDITATVDKVFSTQQECVKELDVLEQKVIAARAVPVMTACLPMKVLRS
jgi:hypothetical protein